MIPAPIYTLLLVFAGIMLFVFAYGLFTTPARKKHAPKRKYPVGTVGENGVCPICGTRLTNGAQIKSALFPGTTDRICHIFGCPHCHPYLEEEVKRTCPVCKKSLPAEGYLVARLFERPGNKRHVHILGCTGCRVPRKN